MLLQDKLLAACISICACPLLVYVTIEITRQISILHRIITEWSTSAICFFVLVSFFISSLIFQKFIKIICIYFVRIRLYSFRFVTGQILGNAVSKKSVNKKHSSLMFSVIRVFVLFFSFSQFPFIRVYFSFGVFSGAERVFHEKSLRFTKSRFRLIFLYVLHKLMNYTFLFNCVLFSLHSYVK